jgi:PAS domain S-box-containing protein
LLFTGVRCHLLSAIDQWRAIGLHPVLGQVLTVVRDATDRRAAEETLRQSQTIFEEFYEHSPDAILVVDETGKIDRVNLQTEVLFELPRERMLGQSIEMLLPERFRARHVAHRASYMKDPKTRPMGTDLQLSAQRADGSEFPVDIMLSPIEIAQRRLVLAVVRDITERKRAETHLQLLMREVDHRAKNILSVVQAIAQRAVASSYQEFISQFRERIRGLSASHGLLVRNEWQNVSLAELARSQLAYVGDLLESRITVHGPDLRITAAAAQTIGMALHELATNAGKYGALSTDTGHVDIVWRLERAGAGRRRFTIEWSECGGPTVVAPTRRGFGWSVLCQLTKMSLGANVTLEYAPTGVIWRLGCPADRVCEGEAGQKNVVAPGELPSKSAPVAARRTKRL